MIAFFDEISMGFQQLIRVSLGGSQVYNGYRHYYIQRFNDTDNQVPGGFLVHGSARVGSDLVVLGSWYGLNMKVLCYAPSTGTATPRA